MLRRLLQLSTALTVFILSSLPVNAGTVNPLLAKDDICGAYEITHINGVNTTIEDARENLGALTSAFGNSHEQHLVRFILAYNQTDWILADIRQAYAQLLASYPGVSFRQWLRAVASGIWPESLRAEAIAEIVGTIGTLFGLDRPSPYYDTDLDRMLAEIGALHQPSRGRMLLVGHSQGNIYANLLYDRLTSATGTLRIPTASLAIVGVAPPTDTLRGSGGYVTSRNDFVVNLIRLAAPNTLPGNITLPRSPADVRGHSFIDVYLANIISRNMIVSRIESALFALSASLNSIDAANLRNYVVASAATWMKCGTNTDPGAPPGTRTCPTPIGLFTDDIIIHALPGSTAWGGATPGTVDDNELVAQDVVRQCVNLYVAENIVRRQAGQSLNFRIPGCPGDPYGSTASLAWSIYSSDGVGFRLPPFYDMAETWMGQLTLERVWMQGHMTCRGVS